MEAPYTFGDLLEWARTIGEPEFYTRVPGPVLIALGTLALRVESSSDRRTGLIELPSAKMLRERLRRDPQLARLWEVRRSDGEATPVRVGRTGENDVAIEDQSLSRNHATLEPLGDCVLVRDADSRNGTFVNDEPVARHPPLRARGGDVLRFGRVSLQFHTPRSLYRSLRACLELR